MLEIADASLLTVTTCARRLEEAADNELHFHWEEIKGLSHKLMRIDQEHQAWAKAQEEDQERSRELSEEDAQEIQGDAEEGIEERVADEAQEGVQEEVREGLQVEDGIPATPDLSSRRNAHQSDQISRGIANRVPSPRTTTKQSARTRLTYEGQKRPHQNTEREGFKRQKQTSNITRPRLSRHQKPPSTNDIETHCSKSSSELANCLLQITASKTYPPLHDGTCDLIKSRLTEGHDGLVAVLKLFEGPLDRQQVDSIIVTIIKWRLAILYEAYAQTASNPSKARFVRYELKYLFKEQGAVTRALAVGEKLRMLHRAYSHPAIIMISAAVSNFSDYRISEVEAACADIKHNRLELELQHLHDIVDQCIECVNELVPDGSSVQIFRQHPPSLPQAASCPPVTGHEAGDVNLADAFSVPSDCARRLLPKETLSGAFNLDDFMNRRDGGGPFRPGYDDVSFTQAFIEDGLIPTP